MAHPLPAPQFGGSVTHVEPYEWMQYPHGCRVACWRGTVDGAGLFTATPGLPPLICTVEGAAWVALYMTAVPIEAAVFGQALAALGDAVLAHLDATGWPVA